jgi:hypothetical protein
MHKRSSTAVDLVVIQELTAEPDLEEVEDKLLALKRIFQIPNFKICHNNPTLNLKEPSDFLKECNLQRYS